MTFDVMWMPALNASLNAISTVLLLFAYTFILRKKIDLHRRFMLTAFGTSILFLISYVIYHAARAGIATTFAGEGWIRPVYYTMLATHVILAAVLPFLAVITLRRGLARKYDQHRRIARWTFPIWLYVSVTGVLVYFMLYHWYPSAP